MRSAGASTSVALEPAELPEDGPEDIENRIVRRVALEHHVARTWRHRELRGSDLRRLPDRPADQFERDAVRLLEHRAAGFELPDPEVAAVDHDAGLVEIDDAAACHRGHRRDLDHVPVSYTHL